MDKRKQEVFWRQGGTAFVVWLAITLLSLCAELWIGNRALWVNFEGRNYFPLFQGQLSGRTFGQDHDHEADYRALAKQHRAILMPVIPYSPTENALAVHSPNAYGPLPPDLAHKNLLGTDPLGRDILARLVYGYRNALIFAALYLIGLTIVGTLLGMIFGYYGGAIDFLGQRLIEIWSNIPFIYVVMIVASITVPNLFWLVILSLVFGWTGLAAFVRTLCFRDKTREFVLAAKAGGASDMRIWWHHLLPQLGTLLLTFLPFQAVGAITTLTSLDFLGFGLRPPAPSWGELLRTGSSSLQAPWIVLSVVGAMTLVLVLLTLIGNALREAFDPKALLRYK